MRFINIIRPGDFVKLKTLEELTQEFGTPTKSGILRAIGFGELDLKNPYKHFTVYPNVKRELGNVLRVKTVANQIDGLEIYFTAENNGIEYFYEDGDDVSFTQHLISEVLINGKWYKANESLNNLIQKN